MVKGKLEGRTLVFRNFEKWVSKKHRSERFSSCTSTLGRRKGISEYWWFNKQISSTYEKAAREVRRFASGWSSSMFTLMRLVDNATKREENLKPAHRLPFPVWYANIDAPTSCVEEISRKGKSAPVNLIIVHNCSLYRINWTIKLSCLLYSFESSKKEKATFPGSKDMFIQNRFRRWT